MKKIIFIVEILLGFLVFAQNPVDINYPVIELGNCGSQEECKNYCDNPNNHLACIEWGKGQGIFSRQEAEKMENIEEIGNMPDSYGPGGCKSPLECDAYCRLLENLDECLQYGIDNGHMSAEEARSIKEKADRGGPGQCKSKEECNGYCRNPENMEECMKFVVEEGKITQEEADFMVEMSKRGDVGKPKGPEIEKEKALRILKEKGAGPGECKNEQECMLYCNDAVHMEECMNFAAENNLMPPEEIERAKKMMSMGGPGGCKNEQECDTFCKKEENRDTCFNFAKESGMLSPEEAMMMEKQMSIIQKLGDKAGPGECRSKEECSAYCQDPQKIQECMKFAAQTGMMKKERVQTMMTQMQMMQKQMEQTEQVNKFFQSEPSSEGAERGGFVPPTNIMPSEETQYRPRPEYERQIPSEGMMFQEGMIPPRETQYGPPPEQYMPPGGEMNLPSPLPPRPEQPLPPPEYQPGSIFNAVFEPFINIF